MTRKFQLFVVCLLAICSSLVTVTWAQRSEGFARYWGSRFGRPEEPGAARARHQLHSLSPIVDRVHHWNLIAINTSGLDHTPLQPGETRVFGEQLGPGRSARAMAIVHIAIFDAMNSIAGGYRGLTNIPDAPGASMEAAVAQAAHDTLVTLFPSQKAHCDQLLAEELASIPEGRAKTDGIRTGGRAARAILQRTANDGSTQEDPVIGVDFFPGDLAGEWRQDPVSLIPIALGARWGDVKPLVVPSAKAFRVPEPPGLNSEAYTAAFNEVKRLGGDGVTTPTERTADQTLAGIYWAYDGTPSLCAPPRLYNQIAVAIAGQMGTDGIELARLLAIVNVAMSDAGIASWESKYHWRFWRPVTGIRESGAGTGPMGLGDSNPSTVGDPAYTPLGAPASNLHGPNFTPPFPAYPSGHAVFGAALFQTLRNFYDTDDIPFTFVSDELNGETLDNQGIARPLLPRSFSSLSEAEEENGQSRIYLGIHWSFDKTEGIAQGRKIANYVYRNAFRPRG